MEVGNGEPCAGVEVGEAGQLGQVLAAAAPSPRHPRPAHQTRLRHLLNNRRRILRIQSWNDFTLIPLQYYRYGTRMVSRGIVVDPHKFQGGSGYKILG